MSDGNREFIAIVWPEEGGTQERVTIAAESWEAAEGLLRETYGQKCGFHLVDTKAANEPRS